MYKGKVTKTTRAKRLGTKIYCPECAYEKTVLGFRWKSSTCARCHVSVSKLDWNLSATDDRGNLMRRNPPKKDCSTVERTGICNDMSVLPPCSPTKTEKINLDCAVDEIVTETADEIMDIFTTHSTNPVFLKHKRNAVLELIRAAIQDSQ